MMLVTLEQASEHLRRDTNDDDADLILKIHAASGSVLNYLKSQRMLYEQEFDARGNPVFDSSGDPVYQLDSAGDRVLRFEVMAATLLMVGDFYKDRDGDDTREYEQGYLPRPVTALLYPLRDPACQ